MFKKLFRKWFIALFVLLSIKLAISADIAPPLAQVCIEQTKSQLTNSLATISVSAGNAARSNIEDLVNYLSGLETNWTYTITKLPHEMPDFGIASLQETFQFYFGGRTNFDEPTARTLLYPRVPLTLNITSLSDNDKHNLLNSELCLRVQWFRLLVKLTPQSVLPEDGNSLVTVNLSSQHLWAFTSNTNLLALLTPDDFDVIVKAVKENISVLTDSYLKQLAAKHQNQFPSPQFSSEEERYRQYIGFRGYLNQSIASFYQTSWAFSTSALDGRASALSAFINYELLFTSSALNAAKAHPGGNKVMVSRISLEINNLLSAISARDVPSGGNGKPFQGSGLSDNELTLVEEVRSYLGVSTNSFSVSYLSQSPSLLDYAKAGNGDKAFADKVSDPVLNMAKPVGLLVNYVRRHPTDEFKADLGQIRAKLEGLQDLAKSMTQK